MFRRLLALLLVLAWLMVPAFARAESTLADAPESLTALEVTLDPTITVTLDGEDTAATVHVTQDGEHYLDATPILDALDDTVVFDETENVLMVTRSQDGVTMSLFTDTGLVQADGKDLGRLSTFGDVRDGQLLLTSNAIAVLSGAKGKYNAKTNAYAFELDPRLKVATGFDINVQGASLIDVSPQPRSVGSVLILPLRPIAEALGSDVSVIDGGNAVRVRRAQDSAVFEMDLNSGLITLNDNPVGTARNTTFIDPVNLMLPSQAVEALTGTNITVDGRTSLIEIDLDDRLDGSVLAGERITDVAADAPFTLESLTFSAGPNELSTAELDFHVKELSGRVRAELPDLPTKGAELQPSWLSLDFGHINGVGGSIGDVSTRRRELDGVGINRLRGIKVGKTTEKGRWSLVAGAPNTGARRISDDQSRLTFSGAAVGGRWADADGWEAGLALAHDSVTDDQRAILTAIYNRLNASSDPDSAWSRVEVVASADMGVFSGPARQRAVDARANAALSFEATESVRVDAFARYDGVEFLRSDLREEAERESITEAFRDEDDLDEDIDDVPDIRRAGTDRLDMGATVRLTPKEFGIFRTPGMSLRAERSQTGLTTSAERSRLDRVSATAASRIGDTDINLSGNASLFRARGELEDDGFDLGLRAHRSFDTATLRVDYRLSDSTLTDRRSVATAQLAMEGYQIPLPRAASISVAPTAGVSVVNGRWSGQGGVRANLESGGLFGEQNRVRAAFGMVQSVDSFGRSRTREYLSVDVARRLPIGDNMALGLGLNSNLSGDVRVGLKLDGRFDFNAPRRLRKSRENTGILSGQVFLDRNRNGVQDDGEPGLPGVTLRLQNTPYALRSGAGGAYTVQNLPTGIYDIRAEGQSLPLGYAQSTDVKSRASISDGRITTLAVPIVPRGQLRGFAFVDADGNGTYDRGELRPDGETLVLRGEDGEAQAFTASFGQYAFDDLAAGAYEVLYRDEVVASIDLTDHDDLLAKLSVPLPPEPKVTDAVEAASTDETLPDTNTRPDNDTREGPEPPDPAP